LAGGDDTTRVPEGASDSFDALLEEVARPPELAPARLRGIGPGTQVATNVQLVRPLGQGGMGSVWVGRHTTLETDVAVKFIRYDVAVGEAAVKRFEREAKLAAQIKSPHVVQMLDHGRMPDGTPYIVMELCEGESLAGRLARTGRLGLGETAALVAQVAEALGAAHELGVVHRDIKPDNVFLLASRRKLFVKVLDFGVAKQTTLSGRGNVTNSGALVGTPLYMSPEHITSAKEADFRADLWALAVVTYEALAGAPPFVAETVGGLCIAINKGAFEPVTCRRPSLPPALDGWFARALHSDPEARFGSADAMADALAAIAGESGERVSHEPSARLDAASEARVPPGEAQATEHAATLPSSPPPGSEPPKHRNPAAAQAEPIGTFAGSTRTFDIPLRPRLPRAFAVAASAALIVLGGHLYLSGRAGDAPAAEPSAAPESSPEPQATAARDAIDAPATSLAPPALAAPEPRVPASPPANAPLEPRSPAGARPPAPSPLPSAAPAAAAPAASVRCEGDDALVFDAATNKYRVRPECR
jgi:serine/threonine-protein kinase